MIVCLLYIVAFLKTLLIEWTATFGDDGMETVDNTSNDWMQIVAKASVLPVNPTPEVPKAEDFADFTNLAEIAEKIPGYVGFFGYCLFTLTILKEKRS